MIDFIKEHHHHFDLKKFVLNALKEDVGDGDHTSLSIIPKTRSAKMQLMVKEAGVIAGLVAAREIYCLLDPRIKIKMYLRDGDPVKKGDIAFVVEGNAQRLLVAERLVLNVMQRMSGIATKTQTLQSLCTGTRAKVIDTRKTTPGFRFFEKWAVVIGGAANHRFGLYDMILIKDNHIDMAGGIAQAIDASAVYLKKKRKKLAVEIETRSLNDVKEVLKHGGVDRIMLDNFSPAQTKLAVKLISGRYQTEASGGINQKNIRDYARCGVDFISIGALTHHVEGLDMSLKAMPS